MANRRRMLVALAVVGVAALTAATAIVLAGRGDGGPADSTAKPSVRFVPVARTNIAMTLSLEGTLGYGVERPVKGGPGRVTWLPAMGTVVSRGQPLFRVNDRPVLLFYGDTPLFRPLTGTGLVGRDVKVVADNLTALGYQIGSQPAVGSTVTQPSAGGPSAGPGRSGTVTVNKGDAVLTPPLVAAVKRWQAKVGLPATGTLEVSDAVVLPQQVRVNAVSAQLGDDAAGALVSVSATAKVVTVEAKATEAEAVRSAERVTVRLPDGSLVTAKVVDVARTAKPAEGSSGSGSGASDQARRTVTITIDDPAKVQSLDSAPVRVEFAANARQGVLVVPVGALLALSEGGYAVQTDNGTLVPVSTGLFDKGMVEVSGATLTEGMKVAASS